MASPAPRTYLLETYGCQMNKAESAAAELDLQRNGFRPTTNPDEADLVLLNTCSVRQTAENRIWGRLGHYRAVKGRHSFVLAVMGCMSERLAEELREQAPEVDLVIGTFNKHRLPELVLSALGGPSPEHVVTGESAYRFAPTHGDTGFKAFVPIMHGCNNFCSYCIVPYVRGREVSRDPDEIRREIRTHAERGVREITLLGQNVNSYRFEPQGDRATGFADLLEDVVEWVRGTSIEWVRFLTSHPKDLSPQVIRLMAEHLSLCNHLPLPVQHGSDRVLKRMERGYTRSRYLDLVTALRGAVPDVALTTDILIGFPGETEEDFLLTLDLMREVRFDDAFMYRYNPREGTKAFGYPDSVSDGEKARRLQAVIDLQREMTFQARQARLGRCERVLIEGVSKQDAGEVLGRTERDDMVVFAADPARIGGFADVELEELRGATFRGTVRGG